MSLETRGQPDAGWLAATVPLFLSRFFEAHDCIRSAKRGEHIYSKLIDLYATKSLQQIRKQKCVFGYSWKPLQKSHIKVPSKYQKAILYRTYLFSQVGNAEVMTLDAGRLNRTGYRARHVHSYGSCHVATQHSTITILFSFCVQK